MPAQALASAPGRMLPPAPARALRPASVPRIAYPRTAYPRTLHPPHPPNATAPSGRGKRADGAVGTTARQGGRLSR
ncbi:hypothetical protein Shyhy02_09410 [Streptomyces hygroscopicus subsp. hygroscopicus]|nr:hypothetical protein Shyhy02_09410 [Streptomyces hygroscopicus subsp. hygroscopicus]